MQYTAQSKTVMWADSLRDDIDLAYKVRYKVDKWYDEQRQNHEHLVDITKDVSRNKETRDD